MLFAMRKRSGQSKSVRLAPPRNENGARFRIRLNICALARTLHSRASLAALFHTCKERVKQRFRVVSVSVVAVDIGE